MVQVRCVSGWPAVAAGLMTFSGRFHGLYVVHVVFGSDLSDRSLEADAEDRWQIRGPKLRHAI